MDDEKYYRLRAVGIYAAGVATIATLLSVIAWLVLANPIKPASTGPAESTTIPTGESLDEAHEPIDPDAKALITRVVAFEETFQSFDWSDPTKREDTLAQFMTPDALAEVLSAEHESVVLQKFINNRGTRTARVISVPIGDIEDDLAEVSTEVTIVSRGEDGTSVQYPIESQTLWVLHEGEWLVYQTDSY